MRQRRPLRPPSCLHAQAVRRFAIAAAAAVAAAATSALPAGGAFFSFLPSTRHSVAEVKGCREASTAGEAADVLADPEVLVCFLHRGDEGAELHRQWCAHLSEVPTFDIYSRTLGADVGPGLADLLPLDLQEGGPSAHLGQLTLQEAQSLATAFREAAAADRCSHHAHADAALRVRLACIDHVQCSRLHWDDVPLRAVSILAGAGTEVLPESRADRGGLARLEALPLDSQGAMTSEEWNRHFVADGNGSPDEAMIQFPSGWAALMKGSSWGACDAENSNSQASPGALHRSPKRATKRVLLQVDFADFVEN
ncbi:unnamed protein product [Polarella glacialis]|uniref:Uncharacterized protein n=1 Tax=Polarella glacialis TaxID=89957 RepID=A0A813HJ31_POLGL|nr:unnamed protein product [Polarella glacialis]